MCGLKKKEKSKWSHGKRLHFLILLGENIKRITLMWAQWEVQREVVMRRSWWCSDHDDERWQLSLNKETLRRNLNKKKEGGWAKWKTKERKRGCWSLKMKMKAVANKWCWRLKKNVASENNEKASPCCALHLPGLSIKKETSVKWSSEAVMIWLMMMIH